MKLNGIFLKTFQILFVTSFFTLFVYTLFLMSWHEKSMIKILSIQSQNTATLLNNLYLGAIEYDDMSYIVNKSLKMIKDSKNIKYIIVSKHNSYSLIHTKNNWKRVEKKDEYWRNSEKNTKNYKIREDRVENENIFHYTQPLITSNKIWGWLHIGFSLKEVNDSILGIYDFMLPLMLCFMMITLFFSFLFAKKISKPIVLLKNSIAKVMKNSNPNACVLAEEDAYIDEILQLAIGFNTMIKDLEKRDREIILSAKVFENTSESVVILDSKLNIKNINKSYRNSFNPTNGKLIGTDFLNSIKELYGTDCFKKLSNSLNKFKSWKGEVKQKNEKSQRVTIDTIRDRKGKVLNYFLIFTDITKLKNTEQKLKQMAFYDSLTTLPNRTLLQENLKQAYNNAKRENTKFALLFLDLDNFKYVNDTLGHDQGDNLLIEVSQRIKDTLRKNDILARVGGDEFVILLENIKDLNSISIVAKKIIQTVSQKFNLLNHDIFVGVSIGISVYPNDGDNLVHLNKYADLAMYNAKDNGKNRYKFFNHQMNIKIQRRNRVEMELRNAIQNDELSLFLQPQFCLNTKKINSAEALLRWNNKKLGSISPVEFISIAEESDLILKIGEWVIKKSFHYGKKISHKIDNFKIAVNISMNQLNYKMFIENLNEIIEISKIDTKVIELEVTESILMDNIESNLNKIDILKNMGIDIAIDDFGTGYSSMSYLKKLPIQTLKIDKTFIDGLPDDENNIAITTAIIAMAKKLNLSVVAEGVETKEQFIWLEDNFCDKIQGYYIAKPMPASEFYDNIEKYVS